MKRFKYFILGLSLVAMQSAMSADEAPAQYNVSTEVGKITLGSMLYDKWAKVIKNGATAKMHPAYPASGKASAEDSWRCKSCHGWDYKGKDGAYGEGKNFTGIKGIKASAGAPVDKIIALLKDKNHQYDGILTPAHFEQLALFVSKGQFDMDKFVDAKSKKPLKANVARGASIYEATCIKCHSHDGKLADEEETMGDLARKNPWEVLHKIHFGQVGSKMISLAAFGPEVSADVLSYVQTLPGKTLKK